MFDLAQLVERVLIGAPDVYRLPMNFRSWLINDNNNEIAVPSVQFTPDARRQFFAVLDSFGGFRKIGPLVVTDLNSLFLSK